MAKSIDEMATDIVAEIVRDLSDREGLGNEWDAIDYDIQCEIRETWRQFVLDEIRNIR